jgi:outer membrane protein W
MKKLLLSALAVFAFGFSYAQKMDGFRVGIDLGYVKPTAGGGGVSFTIEPKYNIADNMNIGLKIGGAGMVKDVIYSNGQTTKAQIGAVAFYTGTFDYYFHESGKDFAPFVGGGISYNSLANVEIKTDNGSSPPITNLDVNTKIGGMLRAGFEYQHFRLGLEYNIIPSSKLQNVSGAEIGTISNSYFGLNLGFYIGGGKWAN